jgi:hypothetical protein
MTDRLRDSVRRLVLAMLPELGNLGQWTYQVQAVTPGPPVLLSGIPVSPDCPYGPLANITLWPGPSGGYATPAAGSLVLVRFNDGDPRQPAVCGLDPNSFATSSKFGAAPGALVPSAWVTAPTIGLLGALGKLATALTTASIANTLTADLAALPPNATTILEGT